MLRTIVQQYYETTYMFEKRKKDAAHNAALVARQDSQGIYITQFITKNKRQVLLMTLTDGTDLAFD